MEGFGRIRLATEHLTFSNCTRIRNEPRSLGGRKETASGERNLDYYTKTMLDRVLGLDPDSRNTSVEFETHDDEFDEIHSMDIFLKLFLECDYLFRPIFITQATKCQLSLPLIVTDPRTSKPTFYSLPYYSLVSQSYTTPEGQPRRIHILTEEINYISFIRLGECESSYKSKALNAVMGLHCCFFTDDMQGSSPNRTLFNGLIEMNWFLPRNKPGQECFSHPLMFLNLRGDALANRKLLNFVMDVSSLVYVFIAVKELNEKKELNIEINKILDTFKHKVCLVIMDPRDKSTPTYKPLTVQSDKSWYFIAQRNKPNIASAITESIKGILGSQPDFPKISLVKCKSVALKHGMEIDDESEEIISNQSFQEKIRQILCGFISHRAGAPPRFDVAAIKEKLLHLQLDSWKERASAIRDQYCVKSDSSLNLEQREQRSRDYRKNLNLARQKQISKLINPTEHNEFLLTILKAIRTHFSNANSLTFVWRTLQTCLERLSLEYSFSMEKASKEEMKAFITGTNSLGIEHIMRELGQIYESFFLARKRDEINHNLDFNVAHLPRFAANIILSGHSFEILDGSVTHVPLTWVSAVLKELSRLVGERKRVFVVGVVGIQSTGKSTLLNTMFGLQFPVKAGRCTRGIFMQMIEADGQLGFDYLILLDTEGLNAIELIEFVPQFHDNELATLIVGLSDLTIVNLMGENQANFKDILQITVLALIKMQLAYTKPKCIFVHQNVADPAAGDAMLCGRKELMKLLDESTRIAAQQGGFKEYEKFNDVIDCDLEFDSYNLPGLFSEYPPMSIVCSQYSRDVENLKNKIIHEYSKKFRIFHTLGFWSKKLGNIWNSLLSQNFVLGYRNVVELCADMEFDEVLGKWHALFDSETNGKLDEAKNYVTNASPKDIDTIFIPSKQLIIVACENAASDKQAESLDYLLNKSDHKELFARWKERANKFFVSSRTQKRDKIIGEFELHYKMRKDAISIEEKFYELRGVILQRAKDDIIQINEKDDWGKPIQHLENLFENHWNEWDAALKENCNSLPFEIHADLQYTFNNNASLKALQISKEERERLLREPDLFAKFNEFQFQLGSHHYEIFNPSTREIEHPRCIFIDFYDTFINHKTKRVVERNDLLQDRIRYLIEYAAILCSSYIHSLSKKNPYSSSYFDSIISIILNQIEEFNEKERSHLTQQIILKDLFMFEYSFFHCCKALPLLTALHEEFISLAGPTTIQNLKKDLQPIFLGMCQGVQVEISCARALAEIIFQKMLHYLEPKLSGDAIHLFQNDVRHLDTFKLRSSLQIQILKDLAVKKDFQTYINYIADPINFIRRWIEEKFTLYCNSDEVHRDIKEQSLDHLIKKLKEFYQNKLMESVKSSKKDWKDSFYDKIKPLTRELRKHDFDLLEVYQNPIQNVEDFLQYFTQAFEQMCTPFKWEKWIKTAITAKLYENRRYLTKHLVQCHSLCPFCREPCILSSMGHRHYCGSLHRPKGMAGYYHQNTYTFSIRECTQSMNTDDTIVYNNTSFKYTDYARINSHFASWNILGEDAIDSKYWQWVFYTFRHEFVSHYGYQYNPQVENWSYLTEEEVFRNLDTHHENFINKAETLFD